MKGIFHATDPRFAHLTGPDPALELVVATDAHEGPVYAADEDALYFTSVPPASIRRIALGGARFPVVPPALTTLRPDANRANGMTMDREGRLVVCEQGTLATPARISRIDRHGGESETLVNAIDGAPLNSPNDVIVAADGAVWFTDPSYGHVQGFRPPPALADRVYRHDPATGATRMVADGFDKPNGLVLSPDGRTLYVGDSGADQDPDRPPRLRPHHIEAFAVGVDGALSQRRVFAVVDRGVPDGLAVNSAGRLFSSFAGGVEARDLDGTLLGEIRLPGAVNFTFGGAERNVLFITADTAVWAARLATQGV